MARYASQHAKHRSLTLAKPVEDLEAEVLSLPPAERSLLLERLIVSLDADPEIQRAWVQEAQRRDAEIESGTVSPVPGEEAVARIRASLA